MYNIDIYNEKIEYNNMIYSLDMLRLKTYITYSEFSNIEFFINSLHKDKIKKFWLSDKKSCFHYNYDISIENTSFYFAFMHNSESINYNREDLKYNFTIEFNPNKARDNILIQYILNKFGNWCIRSIDLAVDIPINILDIIIDKSGKRKLHYISYGSDDLTFYLGAGDGRVKIYNKKNESNLNIVGDLTRVEISVSYDDYPISKIKFFNFDKEMFPELFLNQYVFSFSDLTTNDKTTMAILFAVQRGYSLNDLSRVYKEKIKTLLRGSSQIKFCSTTATTVIKQTIYFYFVKPQSKQIIV